MSDTSVQWHIFIQGETLGPFSQQTVEAMLKQNRLQFADFIWTEGFTKWVRIQDLDEFTALLPAYPKIPIPSRKSATKVQHKKVRIVEPEPEPIEEELTVEEEPDLPPVKVAKAVKAVASEASVEEPKKELKKPQQVWPKIRSYARVPINAKVDLQGHGHYDAFNISEGGVFIESDNPLKLGTEVKFKLSSDSFGKPLDMTGVVIRMGTEMEKKGFAIQFTRVNPAHKRILSDYVKKHTGQ